MTDNSIPPANTLSPVTMFKFLSRNLTMITNPKNPKITEGIPAIISINESITFVYFLCELKLKKRAQPTLKGAAIRTAKNDIYKVPDIIGRYEYLGLELKGLQVLPKIYSLNFISLKKGILSLNM